GDPGSGRMISGVPSAISQVMSTSKVSVRARAVVLAGEPLTPRVFSAIRGTWPGARILNIYGPTETTVYVTSWSSGGGADQVPVIGRPIWNTRVFVLDGGLGLVPPGGAGELYVAGGGGGRVGGSGPAGGAGGFVGGGGGPAAGVPGPSRADRGTVRGVPVRRGRGADVPDRGPGPVERGRAAGVPGPDR